MKKLLTLFMCSCVLSACAVQTGGPEQLKSPCVGLDDSPCGPKRPANPDMQIPA